MTDKSTSNRAHFVGWLSLAQLISWGSIFYTFALIMEPVERELGLSRAQSSLAFSLALLAEGFMAYPVGRWIDRGHERVVMTVGSVLTGICLALHGQVTGLMGFYAVWMGLGVAMACVLYSPAFAVVTRRFPTGFRRAIITMTFLGGLASTVFMPLTAWLISAWGWRHALLPLALLHWLVCAPIHAGLLTRAPASVQTGHVSGKGGTEELSRLLRSTPFIAVGSFVILMMAVTVALPTHMVSLLREHQLSEAWVVAIPASIGVIQVLGRLLLYFFEHHLDLHTANRLIPCLLPMALVCLLAAALSDQVQIWAVLLFVVLYGLGNGLLTIVKGTAMAQYVSQTHAASLNGAVGVPLALARAGAPLTLGLLWTPQVGYTHGIWLLLGLSLAGVAALMLAQRVSLSR